ncbi:hypothetical protein NA655_08395 [Pseudomonas kuykendallii]|uniref:Uncharacterized protein n=1 Tax=Pseudomonas kuykendallii TaxID=1007099 RepID=A0A1H3EM76_9PSED|nr:hypothetical protein [Pseudomonas kuykendallii]MCQ4271038.1 hypothetical protein [Pseudomonas kuykendallii]SDX79677.1 hypothetical protein SAMN05216287_3782 [Pseudomonas kuykendallii]
MTAKTPAQRQAEKRERDRQTEEERLTRLLSRRLQIDLFKRTDAMLIEIMATAHIEEPQDMLQRLIHGAHRLAHQAPAVFAELVRLP